MIQLETLLTYGAQTLADSHELAVQVTRLEAETRELLITYCAHRLRPIRGGSGLDPGHLGTLRQLLKTAPGDPLCDACVAFALELSLEDARALTGSLAERSMAFPRGARTCASCHRSTHTIIYDPLKASTYERRAAEM
jgi:hypothetical protein